MYVHGIRRLFAFAEYVIDKVTMASDVTQVFLRRDRRFRLRCPACGGKMARNRVDLRTAKDLPLGTAGLVILTYEAVQGRCSRCGTFATIHPPGIDPHARATRRLMHFVCRLGRHMPLSHIPEILPISEATAGRWDRKVLQEHLPEPNLENLLILLIDEKAVRRRHGYVTLVMNGETGELLHLAEGKKKESLLSFFDKLSEDQKKRIVAVAIDRAGAYREVVREELPHADVVYDKFHLIANYNEVIDKVRRQEWHKASEEDKGVIKGQRYNLFRNPENRTAPQRRSLYALLRMNRNLAVVYILKDAFVLNYCKHRITLGPLESFNNTVSRIIHRACGIKDLDYLFLKLRQESLDFVPPK